MRGPIATPSNSGNAESHAEDGLVCRGSEPSRLVLFHYHLFKNAGTSIDEMLARNFGRQWESQEFPRQGNAAAVTSFIQQRSDLKAISSHTAFLPVPQISGVRVFPILFLRHPIDRLRSAYEFERRQEAGTPGAHLAKTHDLAGYLQELLKRPRHRQARNFQTFRLSRNEPDNRGSELQRALHALDTLPFVGLVEAYEQSIDRLNGLLRPWLPDFSTSVAHRNATVGSDKQLPERLAEIETMLGREFYLELCAANRNDLILHEELKTRAVRIPPA